MANKGCILGGIVVTTGENDGVVFVENAGTPVSGTIPAGTYYPTDLTDSLIGEIEDSMNATGSLSYIVTLSETSGRITITCTTGNYFTLVDNSSSIFTEAGFSNSSLISSASSPTNQLTADNPPYGTIFWETVDGGEELAADTYWRVRTFGEGKTATNGKRYRRIYGSSRDRELTYENISGYSISSGYGGHYRMIECFQNHWQYEYPLKVFTDNRTLLGSDYFKATIGGNSFEPYRMDNYLDWWGVSLLFHEWVD